MNKKLITVAVLMIAMVLMSRDIKAQTLVRQVKVNVELKDVIGVGPDGPTGSPTVDFVYETVSDYNGNKSVTVPSQLNVTSTKAYNILIKASGDFIGQTTAAKTIPLTILKVSAKTTGGSTFGPDVIPTIANQIIFTGAPATLSQSFDLLYKIDKNAVLLTADKQKYSTDLIYSVSAQ
ncbi:hypothetical protein H7F33_09495 [Pedobacter sp. PAMC26386]|nr:hypothetical protein H7F33_09495 [Pedobacter sp. PAMC26386]